MAEPYDLNFCLPVPEVLENDRIKLVPFIPSIHSPAFVKLAQQFPETFQYLPWPEITGLDMFNELIETSFRKNPAWVLFAIIDETKPSSGPEAPEGAFAGCLGYINTAAHNLATEIGAVVIFPPFQRTHVASNAVGLMLQHALNLPSEGGWGMRRVVWQANFLNKGSVRLAERMGFQMEGILRWDRALPKGRELATNGKGIRKGDPKPECVGRDTAVLSLCWDDWESGGKEHVAAVMARTS